MARTTKLRGCIRSLSEIFGYCLTLVIGRRYSLMRVFLLISVAVLLNACASQPHVGAGGQVDGRLSHGTAGVAVPF